MKNYICTECGHVYCQSIGDSDHNIPRGTPFEKLPNNWKCPKCGSSKKYFKLCGKECDEECKE